MNKRIYLSISSLILIPFTNNLNIYNTNNNLKGNNFNFEYNVDTIKKEMDYPLYKVNDPIIINNVSKFDISYKSFTIDYKNILSNQVFKNNELKKYKKEILYFIENLSFVNQSNLSFFNGSGYSNKIEVNVDGEINKFGYYLLTMNGNEVSFKNMNVNFKIDDKEYNFSLEYYLIDNVYSSLEYFENINELEVFINKYGL